MYDWNPDPNSALWDYLLFAGCALAVIGIIVLSAVLS